MGGVLAAYLITNGIIVYRWVSGPKQAPPPIAFLGASVVFGLTGMIAHSQKNFGNALAWGFLAGALVAPKTNITAIKGIYGTPPMQLLGPNGQAPTGVGPDAPYYTPPNQTEI